MPAQYLPVETPPALTTEQTRIQITQRTPRWNKKQVDLTDALDFWSAAASAANVIMQLSRPEVGYGVAESRVESGSLMHHPWKRLRTTAQYLAVAILGTDEERAAYREAVNVAHRQVRSTAESPVKYNAFNRDLQLWVAACLFIFYEDTYQLLHGAMSPEQAENFYQSAMPIGTTLQVLEDQWPATRADFDVYWNTSCEQIQIDDFVRDFLNELVALKMINIVPRLILAPLLRFLTIGFLAPVFREPMGLEWSETDRRRFEHLFLFVSLVNRFIPRFVRTYNYTILMKDLRRRIRRQKALL
ncbi:oxygenase MpaB family protein [[Mycobacterium] burgundiense]|uniref:Oxygenase MpaB family protein n=1 Tax=[Mycobacterium] burgundiense TaxID=3064286 RepID=A0ABM9M1S6_9MYCO|nr:oxygenase MpaB family protein [Mycolicibacterium sp. MU0053]CAJ1508658.1 oxygenase MpaB family protein [Mycolicibacterium sp. MU0053]